MSSYKMLWSIVLFVVVFFLLSGCEQAAYKSLPGSKQLQPSLPLQEESEDTRSIETTKEEVEKENEEEDTDENDGEGYTITVAEEIDDPNVPTLTHIATHKFFERTHRPEILVHNNKLYLIVSTGGQHKGYIFDASNPTAIDFDDPEKEFTVNSKSEGYDNFADHRAAVVDDELWVVYQGLVWKEGYNPAAATGEPAEPYISSQTLVLSLFSLDGEKISKKEIATTTASGVTFSDMAIVPYNDETLLVNTGGNQFNLREIDSNANILEEYTAITDSLKEVKFSSIANSLLFGHDGSLLIFGTLTIPSPMHHGIVKINADFEVEELIQFPGLEDRQQTFTTGVVYDDGYYYIGYDTAYISEDTSAAAVWSTNYPALTVLDENFNIVLEMDVSEELGFAGVHPNVVIIDDRLFYAWSKKTANGMPQVTIEEYGIS